MKRLFVSVLLIISCFLLQTTVFQWLDFGGIVPNLLIILTASFGFMRGERTGLLFGFFCGLLIDIFFASVLGLNAMIYMYIGYANGKFHSIFYPEDIKLPLFLILIYLNSVIVTKRILILECCMNNHLIKNSRIGHIKYFLIQTFRKQFHYFEKIEYSF